MTCYQPVRAYKSAVFNRDTGKYGITFNPHAALIEGGSFFVPCGRCVGCRVDRSIAWGIRAHCEAQMHEKNIFLTLTYDDQHIPEDHSLSLRDLQTFMKRLRKHAYPSKIRFLAAGEYGPKTLRPHYHALIFNLDFNDKIKVAIRNQLPVYTSETLAEIWQSGSHEIGTVTFKSAKYVARYCMKKIGGPEADNHYYRQSPVNGQYYRVAPEFQTSSKGLGQSWFDKYRNDAFPSDFLVLDGKKVKPPRFFLNQLKEDARDRLMSEHGERHAIQAARREHARQQKADNTKERLAVRETVHTEKLNRLKRGL